MTGPILGYGLFGIWFLFFLGYFIYGEREEYCQLPFWANVGRSAVWGMGSAICVIIFLYALKGIVNFVGVLIEG